VNDVPVITGQDALVMNEDNSITLTKSNIHITDVDNTNAEITLQVLPGSNYTFVDNVVTPEANYSGHLIVYVKAKDLAGESVVYQADILVYAVNDPPVFTSVPVEAIDANSAYVYQVAAEDADINDVLTFTASDLPSWLTFTAASNGGILMGVPTPEDIGSYAIIIKVNDGHMDVMQGFALIVSGPSGINDIDNSMVKLVYPNPASDKIYFKFAKTEPVQIELFDLSGVLQKRISFENKDVIEINIADMAKGIYVYKVYQNGKVGVGKFTKN
jgi:hypothetical protein